MKFTQILAALTMAFAISGAPMPAVAHEFAKGDLVIDHPAARPNRPNRPTAAYMVIMNSGAEADRLLSASSPVFGAIELHKSSKKDGVMSMEKQEAIDIPAGGKATLEPGGLHLMLFNATKSFKDGDAYPLRLTFEKAGNVDVIVNVEKKAGGGAEADHSGHGDHSDHDHSDHNHGDHDHGGEKKTN